MPRSRSLIFLVVLALVVSTSVGVSIGAKPTVVRVGTLVLKINGGVAPKRLPKNRLSPIALNISGNISTADGSHPPAARTVIADFDRNGRVNARGLAACRAGQLVARTTTGAKVACRKAIVGSGSTTVRVAFAESKPFHSSGPLVLFNGGVRRGVTTMYIHAYVNVPAPTAIVTTVKIKRVRKGRFGTRAIARIPVIAGGSGSLTRFNMTIKRGFQFRGRRQSYLLARCADRRFFARASIFFSGGQSMAGTVVRGCSVRG